MITKNKDTGILEFGRLFIGTGFTVRFFLNSSYCFKIIIKRKSYNLKMTSSAISYDNDHFRIYKNGERV